MTRTKRIVALMLAVLVLSALAFAGVAGAKDKDEASGDFTLIAVNESSTDNPLGYTAIDRLRTTDDPTIIGWSGGKCVKLGPSYDDYEYICDMVIRLPEGDLTVTGLVEAESEDPWVFVVTGGNGDFRSARGEVETELISQDPFLVSYTFRLKGASADY
jgi:hypothetical protein